jgi:hypothetical protein
LKRGQLNTVIVVILLIIGIGINIIRFFPNIGKKKPLFEMVDVRTFNDLEPTTIVHYVLRNIGKTEAFDVLTSVTNNEGNESLPAFFENVPVGGEVSINRRLPHGSYSELKIGVLHRDSNEIEEFIVEPDVNEYSMTVPDFIAYNLTLYDIVENNAIKKMAMFWVMNIGGIKSNGVNVSIDGGGNTLLSVLEPGESNKIILEQGITIMGVVDVSIFSEEGIIQVYYITEPAQRT